MMLAVRDDGARWDARYDGRTTGAATIPKGLDGIDLPVGGRCLDVACGLGEQSLWAAQQGFDVIALDASATAIEALDAAAREHGLTARIQARTVDLDEGLPADLGGSCALVVCQRFRDPTLYGALVDALTPGGVLAITVLSQVGAVSPGPFHAPPGELIDSFGCLDVEILDTLEADGEATLIARRRRTD